MVRGRVAGEMMPLMPALHYEAGATEFDDRTRERSPRLGAKEEADRMSLSARQSSHFLVQFESS